MLRFGYNESQGFGKNSDGITVPIQPTSPPLAHCTTSNNMEIKKQRLFSPPPEKPTNENKTSTKNPERVSPSILLSPPLIYPHQHNRHLLHFHAFPSLAQQTRINLNPYAISHPTAHSSLFKLIDYRDCLKNRKDNLGVFISYQGKLLYKGALELYENKILPIYKDIMPERTKVTKHYMRKETDISAKRLSS
ncbi:hypothetical protein M0804_015229 [Polistes exclamans]|nr:hypothetical protein M0804_015229 [Polistes exclamans]